jgi:hypothetical protein
MGMKIKLAVAEVETLIRRVEAHGGLRSLFTVCKAT